MPAVCLPWVPWLGFWGIISRWELMDERRIRLETEHKAQETRLCPQAHSVLSSLRERLGHGVKCTSTVPIQLSERKQELNRNEKLLL